MNIRRLLQARAKLAIEALGDVPPSEVSTLSEMVVRAQDPKFGDYQLNCAMPLAKQLRKPPRDVAKALVEKLDVADIAAPPEIAGPGFINIRLQDPWLAAQLQRMVGDERLGVEPVASPKTYVLDYSAPNVAKPMHVGHIRSTVIGDSLYRVLKFLGHTVIGDNHIGDWGTQFGMIIHGLKTTPGLREKIRNAKTTAEKIAELGGLYQRINRAAGENPEIQKIVLQETAWLHEGLPENLEIWREILPPCLAAIDEVYERLGVTFDHTLGESFYHDRLHAVADELEKKKIAVESDGALCVFIEGIEAPMIVRKKDGAFLYATTDLATIQYRMSEWRPDAMLYVVDHRQSLHFEQLFATARRWGCEGVELQHISFGTVLGDDGKPFKTRSGDTVGLTSLLDEAVSRAHKIVTDNDDSKPNGAELSADERQRVAEAVGIAALKYADLSQNRTSDYTFSYDKMLAMNGNTATYMQYAYARVRSIFRRGGIDIEALRKKSPPIVLAAPAERALAIELLGFSEALDTVLLDYRPNHLTNYLFELAGRYSTFFEQCPVLKADTPETRDSRLLLCDLTARTIKQGLALLGITVVEQM